MTPFTPWAVAILGAACFAILFRTPKRYFIQTVLVGFVSSSCISHMPKEWHVGFATFLAALLIASISHVFARVTRAPAQCFLIPGVIFLVPGTFIYHSFDAAMTGRGTEAVDLGLSAVTISFGISLGILLANWIIPSRRSL